MILNIFTGCEPLKCNEYPMSLAVLCSLLTPRCFCRPVFGLRSHSISVTSRFGTRRCCLRMSTFLQQNNSLILYKTIQSTQFIFDDLNRAQRYTVSIKVFRRIADTMADPDAPKQNIWPLTIWCIRSGARYYLSSPQLKASLHNLTHSNPSSSSFSISQRCVCSGY